MPELVANGPDIPESLLNRFDSGRVVFFCGAGVSATPGSDLPGFGELVEYVYEANHVKPNAVEREALHSDETDIQRRRPSLDKALGLLEARLGAEKVRGAIIRRLEEPPKDELVVHQSLIQLSRQPAGVRLITTNFDRRFIEAGVPEGDVDAAPKLPVPKPHSWSSVVHLHGRIHPKLNASDLVLTAADFGRAYLTERWAARFVTEVFREFTVVFVGYSLGDPVMGYMVDALAAERAKGGQFGEAYAFADHDGTGKGVQRTRDAWLAKNVSPLLYDNAGEHRFLAGTLARWAEVRTDPFQARPQIVLSGLQSMPAGSDDPLVERVTWALDDPTSARALADAPPAIDEAGFARIGAWLDQFSARGLLSCTADASPLAQSGAHPGAIRLVDAGHLATSPDSVDRTRRYLARWIARHLHVPQVLSWVLANGGHMHPALSQEIRIRLSEAGLDVHPKLRLLWTVLLDYRPVDHFGYLWIEDRYKAAGSQAERLRIEEELMRNLAPRLIARPGPPLSLALAHLGGRRASPRALDERAHLEVLAGDEDAHVQVGQMFQEAAVLSRHALTLTTHLEEALALLKASGDHERHSHSSRPSIAPHEQNPEWESDGWSHLIDLVRDSHLALARTDRARADHLLGHWALSTEPLFRRLALNALAEDPKSDVRLARQLLVAGRRPGLWELHLHREVLRFLRLAGSRLPRGLRAEVVRAVHKGPRPGMRNLEEQSIRREKALRLHKLAESGALVDKKSRALAAEVVEEIEANPLHSEEFLVWGGKGARVREEAPPPELREGSYRDVIAAMRDQDAMPLDAVVREYPAKAIAAMRRVGGRGQITLPLWKLFLDGIVHLPNNDPHLLRKWRRAAARALAGAPEELLTNASWAAAEFVRHLAESLGANDETEFRALWGRVWQSTRIGSGEDGDFDDALTTALNHPAGKLAEAALIRLSKHQPTQAAGLPGPVKHYFDAIASDPNGLHGRIMLITSLRQLHAIDPEWTTEHLIKRLDTSASAEAPSLWSAYAAAPRLGPNLLVAFKSPFLEVLRGWAGDAVQARLTGLFVAICLDIPEQLASGEVHGVVDEMTEEALQRVLRSLKQRMKGDHKGDSEARSRVWRDRVQPWLDQYWPRVLCRNTPATSRAMLAMIVEAADAFPEAVDWSLAHLRAVADQGLRPLDLGDTVEQYPDDVFRLLKKVVDDEENPPGQRRVLRRLLDRLKKARPALAQDADFQRLYVLANR